MRKKAPIPFPAKQPDSPPKPGVGQHSRLVLKIGNSRYAFDFHSSVTELEPQPARAFEEAVFQAKAGQILGPVKTEFGYHIIKLEERKLKSFDEVKSEIEKKLRPEKIRKAIEDLQKRVNTSYNAKFFGTAN